MATFVGTTASKAIQAFCDTVDDDLAICSKHGIKPEEPAGVTGRWREGGAGRECFREGGFGSPLRHGGPSPDP